jgi:lycopene cyclase domain-containing protein
MTYFGFLLRFLGVPLILLAILLAWRSRRQGHSGAGTTSPPAWAAILLHALIALVYTTPWDNYLVATRVWWYDPALVTGFTLGYVPIEEYTFFVLQPILSGFWLLALVPYMRSASPDWPDKSAWRIWTAAAGMILWLGSLALLLSSWAPGTYLALELVWAIPPILLQLIFGMDILWRNRRLVLAAILPVTVYLSAADALAIGFGTWTINPARSLGILLGGVLPLEEFVFFLLTNTLVIFGLVLLLAPESQVRFQAIRRQFFPGQVSGSDLSGKSQPIEDSR